MDDDAMIPNDDPAVRAFRAISADADARHAEVMARLAEAPDYTPSFALTNRKLDWLVKACTNGRTVDDLLAQVEDATTRLREPDHEAQCEAIAALNASRKAFDEVRKAQEWSNRVDRSIAEQGKQCRRWGIGGLIAGPLGIAMLAYIVVNIMPAGWLLTERLAARTLGLAMTDAGIRLLVAGNPAMADAIGDGMRIVTENDTVLSACRRKFGDSQRAKTPQKQRARENFPGAFKCTVTIHRLTPHFGEIGNNRNTYLK